MGVLLDRHFLKARRGDMHEVNISEVTALW